MIDSKTLKKSGLVIIGLTLLFCVEEKLSGLALATAFAKMRCGDSYMKEPDAALRQKTPAQPAALY